MAAAIYQAALRYRTSGGEYMKIYHMNGAGNDFVVMDARGQEVFLEMEFYWKAKRKMKNGR